MALPLCWLLSFPTDTEGWHTSPSPSCSSLQPWCFYLFPVVILPLLAAMSLLRCLRAWPRGRFPARSVVAPVGLHAAHPPPFEPQRPSLPSSPGLSPPPFHRRGLATLPEAAATLLTSLHGVLPGDLPWAATLVSSAVLLRAASTPLAVAQARAAAAASAAAPELGRITAVVRRSPGSLPQKWLTYRRLRRVALASAGTSPSRLAPWHLAIQIPGFVGLSLGARALALRGEPGWATGGLADTWRDLTAADASGALPAINAVLVLGMLQRGALAGQRAGDAGGATGGAGGAPPAATAPPAGGKKKMDVWTAWRQLVDSGALRVGAQGMTILLFPAVAGLPTGVVLLWVANAALGVAQTALLTTTAGRRVTGVTAIADAARAAQGPPVLKTLDAAVGDVYAQLKYVNEVVLPRFAAAPPVEATRARVEAAVKAERARGRIGLNLRALLRKDPGSGKPYVAVAVEDRKGFL